MQFILRTIAIFVAVGVAVWLVPGIDIVGTGSSWGSIAVMALIIALLNMTIKPFLQLYRHLHRLRLHEFHPGNRPTPVMEPFLFHLDQNQFLAPKL